MTSTALTLSAITQKTQVIGAVATRTLTSAAQSISRNVDTHAIAEAVRSTQALIVQPTAAAFTRVKNEAQEVLVSLLPEQWADDTARDSVRTGVQWGAKVGSYFGPVGTVVGVSIGAATTIGLRYLTYDAETNTVRPAPLLEGKPVVAPGEEILVLAPKPALKRAHTF